MGTEKLSFTLTGPINDLGYGVHFQNFMEVAADVLEGRKGLNGLDVRPCIIPRPGSQKSYFEGVEGRWERIARALDHAERYDPEMPIIQLWHANQVHDFAGYPRALYTVWEGTQPPPLAIKNFSKVDMLIVPTRFHAGQVGALMGAGRVKSDLRVRVINEGYDSQVYQRPTRNDILLSDNNEDGDYGTVILSVGKLEKRKGVDVAIKAMTAIAKYQSDIEDSDHGVLFILNWCNPFIPSWSAILHKMLTAAGWIGRGRPEDDTTLYFHKEDEEGLVAIKVLNTPLESPHEMRALYSSAHYLFHPSYAEGWGLPILEAAASGCVPIVQRWAGTTEYLSASADEEGYAGYIPLVGVEQVATDGLWFNGDQGNWSVTTIESAVTALKACIETDYDEWNAQRESAIAMASDRSFLHTWIQVKDVVLELLEMKQHAAQAHATNIS